jgi:hypothetical protein
LIRKHSKHSLSQGIGRFHSTREAGGGRWKSLVHLPPLPWETGRRGVKYPPGCNQAQPSVANALGIRQTSLYFRQGHCNFFNNKNKWFKKYLYLDVL